RELVEVVEGLEYEDVCAAAFEDRRLFGEEAGTTLRSELDVAERADRASDEHVPAGYFARLAREPDRGGVDLLDLVLEERRSELRAIRSERVRLDQLGSRPDEGDVH